MKNKKKKINLSPKLVERNNKESGETLNRKQRKPTEIKGGFFEITLTNHYLDSEPRRGGNTQIKVRRKVGPLLAICRSTQEHENTVDKWDSPDEVETSEEHTNDQN